jgi:hypothetical protein
VRDGARARAGASSEARAAYGWLARTQHADGSWATSWRGTEVLDADVDTNQVAYVAVGRLAVARSSPATARSSTPMWPSCGRALDLVVALQQPGGRSPGAAAPTARSTPDALVTGSSSTYQALRCGIALAELGRRAAAVVGGRRRGCCSTPSPPTPRRSSTSAASRWTGTTRCSPARCAGPAGRARLERDWSAFHVPASGCAACPTGRG